VGLSTNSSPFTILVKLSLATLRKSRSAQDPK